MLLKTQEYLQNNTLDDLKNEFGINYKIKDDLVLLKYSQIDSHKHKSHPIVRECRSLILEMGTFDIVSMGFNRFFNFGEIEEDNDFDFYNANIFEKMDGSLITIFQYKCQWRIATSGSIDNVAKPSENSDKTFTDLVLDALPNKKLDTHTLHDKLVINYFDDQLIYIFELTSPNNRIVTPYSETTLTLITARDRCDNFDEVSYKMLQAISHEIGIPYAKDIYDVYSIKDIEKLHTENEATFEGYVAVDYSKFNDETRSYTRVKVKSPRYIELHRMLGRVNNNVSILMLIINNEVDEVLGYFPHYKDEVEEIKKRYIDYKIRAMNYQLEMSNLFITDKKEFAIKVNEVVPKEYRNYIFQIFNSSVIGISEYETNQIERFGLKNYCKRILDILY